MMAADLSISQLLGAGLIATGLLLGAFIAWAAYCAYREHRADAEMAYQWDRALAEIAAQAMPEHDGLTWDLPAQDYSAPQQDYPEWDTVGQATATWQSEPETAPVPVSVISGPLPRLSPSRDADDFIRSMTARTDALIAMLAEPALC